MQKIIVDQSKPPKSRWLLTDSQIQQAKDLVATYVEDMGGLGQFGDELETYAANNLDSSFWDELECLSKICDIPFEEILLTNLYYDLFKVVVGCTALAVDTKNGPIHARNLDWWTTNNLLCAHSALIHYLPGNGRLEFKTIGWPGFASVLSGVAPGRFSVTLNAVISDEPHGRSGSITFLLRHVLSTAINYEAAVKILSETPIVPDCLLLLVGVNAGEMCVIERTPTRYAIRKPDNGFIVVANDYQLMDSNSLEVKNELQKTSCGRYKRVSELVQQCSPQTSDQCFDILGDKNVVMDITVQQMYFSAKLGIVTTQIPEHRR